MYTLYLREGLALSSANCGGGHRVFGVGRPCLNILRVAGDRMSPRAVLAGAFLCSAVLGYLFFHGRVAVRRGPRES